MDLSFYTQRSDVAGSAAFADAAQLNMAEHLTGLVEKRTDALYARNVEVINGNGETSSIHKFALKAQNFFCWLLNVTEEYKTANTEDKTFQELVAVTSKDFKSATTNLVAAAYKKTFTAEECHVFGLGKLAAPGNAAEAAKRLNSQANFKTANAAFTQAFERAFDVYAESAEIAPDQLATVKGQFMKAAMGVLQIEGEKSHIQSEVKDGVTLYHRFKEADPKKGTETLPEENFSIAAKAFAQGMYSAEIQRFARLPIEQIDAISLKREMQQLVQMHRDPNLTVAQAEGIALQDLCDALMVNGPNWANAAAALDNNAAIAAAVTARLAAQRAQIEQKLTRLATILDPQDFAFNGLGEAGIFAGVNDAQGNALNFDDLNSAQLREFFKSGLLKAHRDQEGYIAEGRSANIAGNPYRVLITGANGAQEEVDGHLRVVVGTANVDAQGAAIPGQVLVGGEVLNGEVVVYPVGHAQAGQPILNEQGRTQVRLVDCVVVWGTQLKLNDATNKWNDAIRALRLGNNLTEEQFAAFIANPAIVDQAPLANAFRANLAALRNIDTLRTEIDTLHEEIPQLRNGLDEENVRQTVIAEREAKVTFMRAFIAPENAANRQDAARGVFERARGLLVNVVVPPPVVVVAPPVVVNPPVEVVQVEVEVEGEVIEEQEVAG